MSETTAMLFALTSPHPSLSIEDFNSWYDTRHAPSRAACPGVHNVSRFEARDELKTSAGWTPTPWNWLAMYELESEDALKTDAYQQARKDDGDDESKMFDFLSRRVYQLLSDRKRDGYSDVVSSGETRFLVVESAEPNQTSGLTQNVEKYLSNEAQGSNEFSKVPGWLRTSCWQLTDARDPRNWDQGEEGVAKFLSLHELENTDSASSILGLEDKTNDTFGLRTSERKLLTLWRQF